MSDRGGLSSRNMSTQPPQASRSARPTNLLSSTQKALALLETMAAASRPTGVTELARMVGSSRGTVHKQLSTLVASGWVEQYPDGRYGLSLLPVRIGTAALHQAGLGERIQHVLESIVAETGECTTIAALHRSHAMIVQRAESDQVLSANIKVGTLIPLNAGASALVLLAFASTPEIRTKLRAGGVLLANERRIAKVLKQGVAITDDEYLSGVRAVSIPLHDGFTLSARALTMVGPKDRIDVDQAQVALSAARERIAMLTGFRAPGQA